MAKPRKSNNLQRLRFAPEFEFETNHSQSAIKELFAAKHLRWVVATDYSIPNGWEVRPDDSNELRGKEGMQESQEVLDILNQDFEALQTRKTGFHIHWNLLDDAGVGIMSPKQLTNVCIDWYNFKRVIELILPVGRRGDDHTNLDRGITPHHLENMMAHAERLGRDDKRELSKFLVEKTNHLGDLHINSGIGTLEFRKAIFTVDAIKFETWVNFTRNFIGFSMKPRQKNFRTILDNPNDRLSIHGNMGLAWSFRSVFQYRAGNFGAFEIAEKRALRLARNNPEVVTELKGIVEKMKSRNHS